MVILSLSEKGGETKQLEFDKTEVVIGRVQGNDVVLPKGNVSKRHCRILLQGNSFSVEDFKSTNGTYVNGRKISAITPIFQGDKVYIGDFIIRVENAPAPEAASLGEEAGSLSSALHNRRESAGRPAVMDLEPKPAVDPRKPTMPPPPPAPRKEAPIPVPPPTELDLDDDEPLATAPPPAPPPRATVGAGAPAAALQPPSVAPTAAPPRAAPSEHPSTELPVKQPPPMAPPPPARGRVRSDIPTSIRDQAVVAPSSISDPKNPSAWITRLLEDAAVSAISIIGPESVVVDRAGHRAAVNLADAEIKVLDRTLTDLVRQSGGNHETGIVDVSLPGGSRLVGLFPPLASHPCVSIRRAASVARSVHDLVDKRALSREMGELLEACVAFQRNILVAGDALAVQALEEALAAIIPSSMRVVAFGAHVRPGNPGQAWVDLTVDSTQLDAVGAAFAARPDMIIADLRSPLTNAEVIRQLALGHQGAIATLLARSPGDALTRLEATLASVLGGAEAVRALVAVAFEAIVCAHVTQSGEVQVREIAEPHLVDGALVARILFQYGETGFKPSGKASRLAGTLARLGKTLPGLTAGT